MTWYNVIGLIWLLIGLVVVISLTLVNKQYRKGKPGEIVSFMLLASMTTFVGIGFNSKLSMIFYAVSFLLGFIALTLAIKANKVQINNQ